MNEAPERPLAPPRLLLGVSLLFWGAVIEQPLTGLLCALLVEARWWTDLRWSFGARGYVRAWSLSIVLLALGTTWFWFTGQGRIHLFDVFMWLPVYLLPMILAQQYGTADRIPLNTFSFIARRRVQLDRQAGRPVRPVRLNIGYPYFGGVIMASAVMKAGADSAEFVARWWFFAGTLLLASLALLAVSPFSWKRPVAWLFALMLVAVASFATTAALLGLYALLQDQMAGRNLGIPLASHSRTAIGTVGEIKLSDAIYWRAKGDVPALLRETVYNRYQVGRWAHMPPVGLNRFDDFEEAVLGTVGEEGKQFAFRREDLGMKPGTGRVVTLRGASQQLTPLPLPAGTRVLERLKADGLFFNSLGTVLADNPDYGVLDFSARYQPGGGFDLPPTGNDLQIPVDEAEAVARVCAGLDLRGRSDRDKLKALRNHFLRNFEYTLYVGRAGGATRPAKRAGGRADAATAARKAVGDFLERTRAGHCEYFATGAALVL
ncbi:MAG: hypothetical protein HKN82_02200, partial [Akkermansiaceae bacterium]|nr:hypothetical protein [Akkermansiaceae bacterium]